MIIYGSGSSNLGELHLQGHPCKKCGYPGAHSVLVSGRYVHIFWIPAFPIGRMADAFCPNCENHLEKNQFPPQMRAAYEQQKKSLRRPIWHFSLPILGGLAILAAALVLLFSPSDPRADLLEADLNQAVVAPSMADDSIASKIKDLVDENVGGEVDASENAYFSKVSGDKILVLIKFPNLKKIDKEARPKVMGYVNKVLKNSPGVSDMDRYIGVHGKYNYMMVKTPAGFDNGNIAGRKPLYEFYPSPK